MAGKDDPFVALLDGALDLLHSRLNRRQRHNALRHKPWTRAGPLVDQPVVIGLHTGEFEFWIGEAPECFPRQSSHGGIEHAVIHTVHIHSLQALGGDIGHPWDLLPTLRLMGSITQHRASRSHTGHRQLGAIDHPALGAIGLLHNMGDTLTPLRPRHTLGPDFGVLLDVVIHTD